ncbi:MAG TPA: LysE family translocator [Burkholderiales bacterium]|nr:LysE family translocator [Burkholderiales bacterium]
MEADQAAAFTLFAVVAAITPGPSNVMLTATGAVAGIVRGLPCLLGVAAGMAVMMSSVAFGLGAVVLSQPVLLGVLKAGGAGFLLWLAWKVATAPPAAHDAQASPVGFFGAAAFQWLNPKSWLVSTSAAGTFLRADGDAARQALAIGALFFVVALATGFVWLGFGSSVRGWLAVPTRQRTFNVAMAVLLALSVLLFLP